VPALALIANGFSGVLVSPARWRPPEGIEDRDRVEVVPPVRDLTVLDGDHGNEAVVVGATGVRDSAVRGVLEYHDRRFAVPVAGQFVGAVQDDPGGPWLR